MEEEKRYIDSLLRNEKYLNELENMYMEMKGINRFKRKLNEIENELMWFVGNERNGYLSDYVSFYNHAFQYYLPEKNKTIVQAVYKAFLEEYKMDEIPGFIYCMALLGHLAKERMAYWAKDYDSLSLAQKKEYNILHCKCKLLSGFLEKIDELVAVFINSIDTAEVAYLDDDIKTLDNRAIKHRFMTALHMRDKNMAFKLLGRLRELDDGEDYYFEALTHFINEEYEEAIRYINKVEKENIDYPSATALKMECYSLLGDLSGFMKCIEANIDMTFEYWHMLYLMMSLCLRINPSEDCFMALDEEVFQKIRYNEQEAPYFTGMSYRLVSNIIVEGLEIIESIDTYSEIIDDFDIPDEKVKRLIQLKSALALFPVDFNRYLDFEYLEDKEIQDVKEDAKQQLLILLLNNNPDTSFDNFYQAYTVQFRLGDIEYFIKNVCSNFDALLLRLENGEARVEELFRLAYIESMIRGTVDDKLKAYVEQHTDETISQRILDKGILNILSVKGKIAYESAEWQFEKSKEIDYSWKDAGLISLGFYRILEVELNQKLLIPLLSSIGYSNLKNTYDMHRNSLLTAEEKQQYGKKWSPTLRTFKGLEASDFKGDGFMLGNIDFILKAIGSQYDAADPVAVLLKNGLGDVLTAYGMEKFEEGFFEDITKDTSRNKFRNPPAHTKYLSYEVAKECREVFRNTIWEFGKIFKACVS